MQDLSYRTYVADAKLREALERDARRARAEAIYHFAARPLMALLRWVLRRPALTAELKRGSTLMLERGRATVVGVVKGDVWLTQHQDIRDYLMGAGDRVVLNGKGLAVIYAFADSKLRLAA